MLIECTLCTVHRPTNELGSIDDVFSLDAWLKNVLGLAVVLVLLGLTLGITTWSFCAYVRLLRRDGREVPVEGAVVTTLYARSLLAASYKRAACVRKISHGIRTKTHCGPILFHLRGDPFSKCSDTHDRETIVHLHAR